jgi:hypothetical protein
MIEIRNAYKTVVRKLVETDNLRERDIDGRILLNRVRGCGLDSFGSR